MTENELELIHEEAAFMSAAFDDMDDETLALCHYASPYYNPVYAHNYYMAHRKLKGKYKGTANKLMNFGDKYVMDSEGREAYQQESDKITKKYDTKIRSKYQESRKDIEKVREKQAAKKDIYKKAAEAELKIARKANDVLDGGIGGMMNKASQIHKKYARRKKNAREDAKADIKDIKETTDKKHLDWAITKDTENYEAKKKQMNKSAARKAKKATNVAIAAYEIGKHIIK